MIRHGHTFRTIYDPNVFEFYCDECHIVMYDRKGSIAGIGIIDADDYDKVKDYKWYCRNDYIQSKSFKLPKDRSMFLHRFLFDYEGELFVDHIDGNPFNNRRNNLRFCTTAENMRNQKKRMKNGNIIGVNYGRWNGKMKWIPSLMKNYKGVWLGVYDTKEEAIIARLKAEKKYFGEFGPQQHLYEKYNI